MQVQRSIRKEWQRNAATRLYWQGVRQSAAAQRAHDLWAAAGVESLGANVEFASFWDAGSRETPVTVENVKATMERNRGASEHRVQDQAVGPITVFGTDGPMPTLALAPRVPGPCGPWQFVGAHGSARAIASHSLRRFNPLSRPGGE